MRTFIFESVEDLTDNYHANGGAVVIAESLDRVYEINDRLRDQKPDYEYESQGEEKIFIFPDAGCC